LTAAQLERNFRRSALHGDPERPSIYWRPDSDSEGERTTLGRIPLV